MSTIKQIFILGNHGVGKGLIAKALSDKLNWDLINANFGLEFNIGKDIQSIMGEIGLRKFLATQHEILLEFQHKENIIVVTDPTVILSDDNRKLLSSVFSIHIKANKKTLLERLQDNIKPLLPNANIDKLVSEFEELRNDLYSRCAKFSIDTDNNDLDHHVNKIISTIEQGDS